MARTVSTVPIDVQALRAREFPGIAETTYLNAASVAPIPERTRRELDRWNGKRARIHTWTDDDFAGVVQRAREAAARLVGAGTDEVALVSNTSHGINLAAQCLPVRPGSVIVASDREFPANVYPWMSPATGARLELVPTDPYGRPDEARILERLDRGDVSVFAVSAVQFATGYLADLAKLGRFCRERGIFFVVDAIQALGQVPLDVRGIHADVLATGGHKWLCAPFGTGFVYVRREILASMEPRVVGWTSMKASADYSRILDYRWEFAEEARKFEVATLPFHDLGGFTTSIELLLETGIEAVREHVLALLDPLIDRLRELPGVEVVSELAPERRSGIFCFRTPSSADTFRALTAAGVVCVLREGAIRLAPHLYNDPGDVERVIEVLEREAAG